MKGLKKSASDIKGYGQYRLPSGGVRLVYDLKDSVDLAIFAQDPFFSYSKSILGDISKYGCKILNLNTIPEATVGSEVTVFVRHTHKEVSLKDIDKWMALYGTLLTESRSKHNTHYSLCTSLISNTTYYN